jgi:phosphoribosylanthranilate isomerase
VDDLRAARAATALPLLAKGFFTAEDDLITLRDAGADAVLLLLRDLDDKAAARLQGRVRELGLDALVEAHDAEELSRAVALGADPIGVNARDLATFEIDRTTQLELVARAPRDRTIVAESGITHRRHAIEAELAGAQAVLVGSTLMRAPDPGAALVDLIGRPVVKICGLTRQEDVDAAVAAGADLCGFVLEPTSPRVAEGILDVGDAALSVAVVVGEESVDGADLLQRYEREEGSVRGRDAVLLRQERAVATVIDLPWQEEDATHLDRARAVGGRLMLAGGLGPETVAHAVAAVRPWAVDASSSLESSPGIKDHGRLRAFVEAARG